MNWGPGRLMRRLSLASLVAAALFAVAPTGATAGTQLGETFTPDATPCAGDTTYLQTGSPGDQYIVPQAGVITSWSYQAPASPPQVKFKVGRAAGTDTFTIIGESDLKTPSAGSFNTYPIQIPVRTGDVIGIYLTPDTNCGRLDGDYSDHYFNDDVLRGETEVFTPEGALQFNIAASLDPETKKCKGQAPTIAGTPGKDTLVGTADDDVIVGLGGKDKIKGLEGLIASAAKAARTSSRAAVARTSSRVERRPTS